MTYLFANRIVLNILAPILICALAAACTSGGGGHSQASSALPQAAGTGSVTLDWVAPVSNSDGTTLTNLAGYHIHYGTDSAAMNDVIQVPTPGLTVYVIDNLPTGTYYFSITSYSAAGVESASSPVISTAVA